MDTLTAPLTSIRIKEISGLYFPPNDVLNNAAEKMMRQVDIIRAMALGNTERFPVNIVFEDTGGIKLVRAAVWVITEEKMVLEGGSIIPIHRVQEIGFF